MGWSGDRHECCSEPIVPRLWGMASRVTAVAEPRLPLVICSCVPLGFCAPAFWHISPD